MSALYATAALTVIAWTRAIGFALLLCRSRSLQKANSVRLPIHLFADRRRTDLPMKASDPSLAPLAAVAARQADDLNRGITYQVWRTVEAWVNLRDDQQLHLESLEDFDVVGKGAAVAVQVKATAAPVTLRSGAIVELLVNFWRACRDNLPKEVHYRLITTSAVGAEQSSPLSIPKGLELWRECALRGATDKVSELQKFLASDPSIKGRLKDTGPEPAPDPSLLAFLQSAKPEEVLARLIRRISFQTESADADLVREAVGIALRAHGEKLGVRPSESGAALDRLFRVAAETAGRKSDRVLTRDRFRREYEDATTQRLTAGEIEAIRSAAPIPIMPSGIPGSAAAFGIVLGTELVVHRGVPDLPDPILARKKVVQAVVTHVRQVGTMVIRGSSGMGKSTLARLVARELGLDWLWVDFQSLPVVAIPHVVRAVSLAFVENPSLRNLVLDNLNFEPADLAGLENPLAVANRTARNRGGWVLVTTQRELPVRLQGKLAVQPADLFDVPRLDDVDIESFGVLLGCPATLANAWCKIIAVQSSGHPRLVHARLAGLQAARWPSPQASDLLATVPEIREELDLARQLVDRATAGDKELLYRLSVASGPFRREHAVTLGALASPVPYPADAFDRLVGPWIDRLRGGYFRLSPLLAGAAVRNWPVEQVRQIRSGLAHAMLAGSNKTLIEANEILFQGLVAQDEKAVSAIVVSLLTQGFDKLEQFADRLDWLTLFGRKEGGAVFAGNAALNFILRLLQFRIMSITAPQRANEICEIIDRESATTDSKWVKESRAMWLSTALIYFQAKVPPRTRLRYWDELRALMAVSPELRKLSEGMAKLGAGLPDAPTTDAAGHLLMMILAQGMDDSQLVEFADAVNELPEASRNAVLGYLPKLLFPLRLMVDRTWIREADRSAPDWPRLLQNLTTLRERTAGWGLPKLGSYTARARAAVEDEYCGVPAAAIAILDEAAKEAGADIRLIEDQKAMVLYRQKRHREALDIWRRLLPAWTLEKRTADHTFFFASQRAGDCAGVLGDWPLAAGIFRRAAAMAKVVDERLSEATFSADQGLAEWKSGQRTTALTLVADSLSRLEALKKGDDPELHVHRARKCVEQVIKWMRFDAGVRDLPEWEPPAGMCSRLESGEKMKDYPACPFDLLWFFLADTEYHAGLGAVIFDRAWKRCLKSNFASFRGFMSYLKVQIAFAGSDFSTLMDDVEGLVQRTAEAKAQDALGKPPVEPDAYGKIARVEASPAMEDAIIAALIILAASGRPLGAFLPAWHRAAKRWPGGTALIAIVQDVERTLNADETMLPQLFNRNERKLIRSVAAVRMSCRTNLPLDAAMVGHTSISAFVMKSQFRHSVEDRWAELVRSEWRRRIAVPALFSTPRLTIPPIQAACNDPASGMMLVAKILLEARHAAQVTIPPDIIEIWRVTATPPEAPSS